MKKISLFLFLILLSSSCVFARQKETSQIQKIKEFQDELNADFKDPEESPLTEKDFENFTSLDFFPIDLKYAFKTKFIRTPNQESFKMATTSTNRFPVYEKYGEVHFIYEGEKVALNIYQSHELRETEEYKDYLFLPFKDPTNGKETYGGGRYIGLHIPENDTLIVDFNQAYNPYCAYNTTYACPLVPKENTLPFKIFAGVKAFKK